MIFTNLSPNIIRVYIRFFDSLMKQPSESKNFDNYKQFKENAEKTLSAITGTSNI